MVGSALRLDFHVVVVVVVVVYHLGAHGQNVFLNPSNFSAFSQVCPKHVHQFNC